MGRTLKCGVRSAPAGKKGMNNFRQRKKTKSIAFVPEKMPLLSDMGDLNKLEKDK
jgi:hypothetical protein